MISLDSGDRRVLVGAQTALSDDGNVVSKGDMRAQIEQVGKNIQACLKVAGAKASDIILTRAYVTDADAFKQNADMRTEYLGPESPTSTVTTVPKLAAGPDYLIEIEAVANLNSPSAASAGPKQWVSPRQNQRKPAFFNPSSTWSRASCVPNCAAKIRLSKNGERRMIVARSPSASWFLPSSAYAAARNGWVSV